MNISETTTFTQIRQLLDTNERAVVAIRQEPAQAADVIIGVEKVLALLEQLHATGVDIRAEEGRADSLRGRLLREARLVARQVNKSGRGVELTSSELWHEIQSLDVAERSHQQRRWLIGGGAAALIALLLFVVLPRLFPAPPSANIIAVSQIAGQGNLQGALQRALEEQSQAPNDQQIGVWVAALQQQLGQTEQAEASWKVARKRYPDDVTFLSDRIGVALQLNDLASAERDAMSLQAMPNGVAIGTYQLASVREYQKRYGEALKLYEQASDLANKEGKPELVVAARTRMAAIMQSPQ